MAAQLEENVQDEAETDYDDADYDETDFPDSDEEDICVHSDEMAKIVKLRKDEFQSIQYWMIFEVQLPEYITTFNKHGYDSWITIKNITDKELLSIGINKPGHRKKILLYVSMLKKMK